MVFLKMKNFIVDLKIIVRLSFKKKFIYPLEDILDLNLPDNTVSETENFNILKLAKHKKGKI